MCILISFKLFIKALSDPNLPKNVKVHGNYVDV